LAAVIGPGHNKAMIKANRLGSSTPAREEGEQGNESLRFALAELFR
jgi:hypothetical protein